MHKRERPTNRLESKWTVFQGILKLSRHKHITRSRLIEYSKVNIKPKQIYCCWHKNKSKKACTKMFQNVTLLHV